MNSFLILKTSGNEVYYTNSLMILIKMMLCGKLHCQKFLKLKIFSYKIILSIHQPRYDRILGMRVSGSGGLTGWWIVQ